MLVLGSACSVLSKKRELSNMCVCACFGEGKERERIEVEVLDGQRGKR